MLHVTLSQALRQLNAKEFAERAVVLKLSATFHYIERLEVLGAEA